jgi:chromatin remodeling complex protein RSC6
MAQKVNPLMNKLETPNEKLAAIVGSKPLNRPTIVKKV